LFRGISLKAKKEDTHKGKEEVRFGKEVKCINLRNKKGEDKMSCRERNIKC